MPRETVVYRRTQLYEEVWSEAVETVATRYGVSGVALAKTCRKLRVPLPGRGYWARKRAGQRLKRPPLPPLKKGEEEEFSVSRWLEPERPKPVLSPETEAMIVKEQAPEAVIEVLATLDHPHKLVAMTSKLLQRAKPTDGVVRCRDRRCLDVAVSPAALDRALRTLDALLHALDARELDVEVTEVRAYDPSDRYSTRREEEVPSNVTRVKVANEWICFALSEKVSHKRPPPPPAPKQMRDLQADIWQRMNRPPTEYVPTGQLTLAITNADYLPVTSSWRDGKRRQLEACLNEFVSSLYLVADAMKARRVEQERARKEAEQAEKRRWEEQRRREEEAKRAKELVETVEQWRLARDIRAYVSEARGMVTDADLTMAAGSPFDNSLMFASAYADRVDPLAGLRAEVAKVTAERAAQETNAEASAAANRPEAEKQ